MEDTRLDAFLSSVRELVDGGDAHRVLESGETLAKDSSLEELATARAALESAVRILERREQDTAALVKLGERLTALFLGAVGEEARRDSREYSHSLGERILDELEHRRLAPTDLAERLGVEISQISRAARTLQDDGRLKVNRDANDGRRRLYEAATTGVAARNRWRWRTFVDRLPMLDRSDVASDLLPHRIGDDLDRAAMRQVCAAFEADLAEGRYRPTPSHEVDIPKPAGGQRPAAALRLADRLVYAALVERCRAEIEASLVSDRRVLWPRGKRSDKKWVKFEGFVADSGETHVLSVDVQSFYDSIQHEVLGDALTRADCDSQVVKTLTQWLGEVMGRQQGLPQGLGASDPLASLVLSSLDRALSRKGLRYVRHGDDLRVMGSYDAVKDTRRVVRDELRDLGLVMNDDKTRVLRRDTYLERRSEIVRGVQEYLDAGDVVERSSAIYRLIGALEADDELSWSWYHGSVSVPEVLNSLGSTIEPGDAHAVMILISEAATAEDEAARLEARLTRHVRRPRSAETTLLVRAGISLLASAGAAVPEIDLEASVVARPEYADVLSTYVEQAAPKSPARVAGLLQEIEETGVTYDAQWLRLYRALDDVASDDFDDLALTHLNSQDQSWIRRLRAARFMARRGRLDADYLPELRDRAPLALRDDMLDVVAVSSPESVLSLLADEGTVVRALLGAAA